MSGIPNRSRASVRRYTDFRHPTYTQDGFTAKSILVTSVGSAFTWPIGIFEVVRHKHATSVAEAVIGDLESLNLQVPTLNCSLPTPRQDLGRRWPVLSSPLLDLPFADPPRPELRQHRGSRLWMQQQTRLNAVRKLANTGCSDVAIFSVAIAARIAALVCTRRSTPNAVRTSTRSPSSRMASISRVSDSSDDRGSVCSRIQTQRRPQSS